MVYWQVGFQWQNYHLSWQYAVVFFAPSRSGVKNISAACRGTVSHVYLSNIITKPGESSEILFFLHQIILIITNFKRRHAKKLQTKRLIQILQTGRLSITFPSQAVLYYELLSHNSIYHVLKWYTVPILDFSTVYKPVHNREMHTSFAYSCIQVYYIQTP